MPSHLFSLGSQKPQKKKNGGERFDVNAKNFPVLSKMALSLLELNEKGFREPHWHPNAHELSYCLEGKALMTQFGPGHAHHTFVISPGDIAFVPMGVMHHIENIGNSPLKMLLCFSDENPEELELTTSLQVMPNRVLGAVFKQNETFFELLKKDKEIGFIETQEKPDHSSLSMTTSPFKLALEHSIPQVQTAGGFVRISNSYYLSSLKDLAIYSLHLSAQGIREPHWHPNAHELNFVIKGSVRITLLSPDGDVETFDMKPKDISFLPKGYLHHIENIGNGEAQLAVFFSHENPSDIGISGCLGAYSNALLSSLFKMPTDYFDNLPKYQESLLVVGGAG